MSPTNPSPKERFCQSGTFVAEHRTMIQTSAFDRGVDYAMLELSRKISTTDISEVPYRSAMMQGAQEFLRILVTLAEQPQPQPRRDFDNLK